MVDGLADGLWLKQCKASWQFEAPLTAALASRWADRVAEVVDHGEDWLLTRDAGMQIAEDDPLWPVAVQRYAELQQGEDDVADERLRRFEPRFAELCAELAGHGVPETIQHDDLHQFNVYVRDGLTRILDWGDSSVGHPYFSLVATLRHVEDRGIARAFLDAWGGDEETLALALRVGRIAHAFKLRPRGADDDDWPRVVALAIDQTSE